MVVFTQSIEARCLVDDEDVVGAAPTGDAPTTSEWSTILLSTKVRLILEVLRYWILATFVYNIAILLLGIVGLFTYLCKFSE